MPPPTPITLNECHTVFTKWLGAGYDIEALDAVLAAAAVEQLGGDPVWLLYISGAGNAKTETVAALSGIGAHIESTIASEGALLSGTARKERTKGSTGGLLRRIGPKGILVLKDFTSLMSMERVTRGLVISAMREIYDGRWTRNIGTDGGRTLLWEGRLVLIGACTTAYDVHHAVVAAMGDRFVLLRTDSNAGREGATRQALSNIDKEQQMRTELAAAAGGVLASVNRDRIELTEGSIDALVLAADLVTLARTAVERDMRGEVVEAHAPEMPTRLVKMLGQIMRGALSLGITQAAALTIALRVAADCIPPSRLELLRALDKQPGSTVTDLTKELQRPRNTIRRNVDALHALRLVVHYDESYIKPDGGPGTRWSYELAEDIDPRILSGDVWVGTGTQNKRGEETDKEDEGEEGEDPVSPSPHISGQDPEDRRTARRPGGFNHCAEDLCEDIIGPDDVYCLRHAG